MKPAATFRFLCMPATPCAQSRQPGSCFGAASTKWWCVRTFPCTNARDFNRTRRRTLPPRPTSTTKAAKWPTPCAIAILFVTKPPLVSTCSRTAVSPSAVARTIPTITRLRICICTLIPVCAFGWATTSCPGVQVCWWATPSMPRACKLSRRRPGNRPGSGHTRACRSQAFFVGQPLRSAFIATGK